MCLLRVHLPRLPGPACAVREGERGMSRHVYLPDAPQDEGAKMAAQMRAQALHREDRLARRAELLRERNWEATDQLRERADPMGLAVLDTGEGRVVVACAVTGEVETFLGEDMLDVTLEKARQFIDALEPPSCSSWGVDLPICKPGGPMAPGVFRGGLLDGQRHPVPEHGPAWIRYHDHGFVSWYAHRHGTKRTYQLAGVNQGSEYKVNKVNEVNEVNTTSSPPGEKSGHVRVSEIDSEKERR
jgi:hypothetical protein